MKAVKEQLKDNQSDACVYEISWQTRPKFVETFHSKQQMSKSWKKTSVGPQWH